MLVSFLVICLISYLISSIAKNGLFFFVSALATIVLNIEVLSLFKQICPGGILLLNTITLIIVSAFWIKTGRPLLKPNKDKIKSAFNKIKNSMKLDKVLLILGIGFLFLLASGFLLSAFLPVNDFDALDYHTYRALVFADKGYILHFDTKDIRNLVMPINSELIYAWIYSLTGRDIGFSFLEFASFIFGIMGIWNILGRLKISVRKRLWAIFAFSSLAGIISQISSTQTDLLVGTLLLYSIIFFYDYVKNNGKRYVFFSALAFALALGVKSTAFMAGLSILGLFLFYSVKKKCTGKFFKFIGYLTVNFLVFSSYNYILNFIDFSNPLGSEFSINGHSFWGGISAFFANFIRYNIQMFDFAGFRWGLYFSVLMVKIQDIIFALLNIPPDKGVIMEMLAPNAGLAEQTIGFGVTGILIFVPSVITASFLLFKKRYAKENWKILYTLGFLFYLNLIVLSFALGYMVYSIRFIAAFVTLSAPALAVLYFKKNNIYKIIAAIFCLIYLFVISGQLAARPLYKLVGEYKNEKSYDNFVHNVRCMNYEFFKGERPSCKIDEALFLGIEDYKTIGFFGDASILMHLVKINTKKKHLVVDELIFTRFNTYDIKKYDYIITPYPNQDLNVFTNEDKKLKTAGKYPKNCYPANFKINQKMVGIQCGIPYTKIENNGFAPIRNTRIHWLDIDNNDKFAQYIIWKNTKSLL